MAGKMKSKALATWDEELAKQAEAAAGMEANVAGGQFFSLKNGTLSFNDAPVPGNQMAVVVLDAVLENVWYEGKYNPEVVNPPTCFAFGRDEREIAPHQAVVDAGQAQAESCAVCPKNEWGTADQGRGKACRNTRRLGLIPAGEINDKTGAFEAFEEVEHFREATVAYLRVPPTSLRGYAAFVKQVAGTLRRPPHGIFTRVRVVPDPKTQIKVTFEPLDQVPDELMATVMARHEEVAKLIEFPYQLADPDAVPAAPARGAQQRGRPATPAGRGMRKF